jgi:hypothetical protein
VQLLQMNGHRLERLRQILAEVSHRDKNDEDVDDEHEVSKAEELSIKARVDWAIHLHKEVHSYVRSGLQIMQVATVVAGAAITTVFRDADAQTPAITVAPYVIGTLLILWTEYTREVMINAAIIEHMEGRIASQLGQSPLIHERLLGSGSYSRLTALTNNLLALGLYGISIVWSVLNGRRAISQDWQHLNWAGLAILTLGLVTVSIDTMRARSAVLKGADEMDPPITGDQVDVNTGSALAIERRTDSLELDGEGSGSREYSSAPTPDVPSLPKDLPR